MCAPLDPLDPATASPHPTTAWPAHGNAARSCVTIVDTFSCNVANQTAGNCGSFTVCDGNDPLYQSGVLTALAPPAAATELPAAPGKPLRPGLSHFLLAGHACTLGAVDATLAALAGEAGAWSDRFRESATAHAASVTPLGARLLENSL